MLGAMGLCEWPGPLSLAHTGAAAGAAAQTKSLFITLGYFLFFFFLFATFPLRGKPDPVQETGGVVTTGALSAAGRGPRGRWGQGCETVLWMQRVS